MNFIKKLFKKNKKEEPIKIGGHDIDDGSEVSDQEPVVEVPTEPKKVEPVARKKPGRPKGSTKKTPSKSTPSKKVPSKKKA